MKKLKFTEEEIKYLDSLNAFDHKVDYYNLSLDDYLVLEDIVGMDLMNATIAPEKYGKDKFLFYQNTIDKLGMW